jgi:hypothetical protein
MTFVLLIFPDIGVVMLVMVKQGDPLYKIEKGLFVAAVGKQKSPPHMGHWSNPACRQGSTLSMACKDEPGNPLALGAFAVLKIVRPAHAALIVRRPAEGFAGNDFGYSVDVDPRLQCFTFYGLPFAPLKKLFERHLIGAEGRQLTRAFFGRHAQKRLRFPSQIFDVDQGDSNR